MASLLSYEADWLSCFQDFSGAAPGSLRAAKRTRASQTRQKTRR